MEPGFASAFIFLFTFESKHFFCTMEDTYFAMVCFLLLIDSQENGIEKSPNDPQHYYSFTLENGMATLIISDEGADISNVCMSVNAGSLNDPSDIPGLAHFVEVSFSSFV